MRYSPAAPKTMANIMAMMHIPPMMVSTAEAGAWRYSADTGTFVADLLGACLINLLYDNTQAITTRYLSTGEIVW